MTILDTHAWIWWSSSPGKLSARAQEALRDSSDIGVCAISCWEVAMLVTRGWLELDRPVVVWVKQALAQPRVSLLPLSPEIAVQAAGLTGRLHGDPADRIIAATALHHRAAILTRDLRLRACKEIQTVW
jgi:PIN domain nuclease of toxin-antitoxin system